MASSLMKKTFGLSRTYLRTRIAASVKHYSEKPYPYYDPAEGKIGTSISSSKSADLACFC